MSNGIQDNDLLIRCQIGASTQGEGNRLFYTLHRVPTNEKVGGPFATKDSAIEIALGRGQEQGVDVWLQIAPDNDHFQLVQS
jgi:hypothetical protein